PQNLIGDSERIRQILVNLLGNSLKFTSQGNIDLHVQTENSEQDDKLLLHFEVRDTGVGLPEGDTEKLFAAFTQADMSPTRNYGGTGLGLAISQKLVEVMKGRIWCKNNQPKGCSFFFTIEVGQDNLRQEKIDSNKRQKLNSDADKQELQPKERPLNVLLAEDSPVNQTLMIALLSKWGHKVVVAGTGLEAIQLWQTNAERFDLILMDVLMPACDGLEAARKIRQLENALSERVPIIALTAQALAGDRDACIEAGMDAYVSKPISQPKLHSLMKRFS
ncbi:ATP-binding protein, partial [bacterium]|nr:ATP-binding protein [bacterium]